VNTFLLGFEAMIGLLASILVFGRYSRARQTRDFTLAIAIFILGFVLPLFLAVSDKTPGGGVDVIDLLLVIPFLALLAGVFVEFAAYWDRAPRTMSIPEETGDLSLVDDLTGLRSRRGLALAAAPILKLAQREKSTVTILFVDLDNLKGINESFGGDQGARALQATASILTDAVRDSDVVARLGDDQFCILLSPGSQPEVVLERIGQFLDAQEKGSREKWMLSLSTGSTTFDPTSDTTIRELITKADAAMYWETS
jgi:diguanylate cyclase (GGDEF)-like protein